MYDKNSRRLYLIVYNRKDWRVSYEKRYQNIKTGEKLGFVVKLVEDGGLEYEDSLKNGIPIVSYTAKSLYE